MATTELAPWSTWRKVGFRFAFVYAVLYFSPLSPTMAGSFGSLWGSSSLVPAYEAFWYRVVPWVATHLFGIREAFDVHAWSADSTYLNLKSLCYGVIAIVAAAVWSALDRRRSDYATLDQWLRWYARIVLGSAMFLYGASKVVPTQMWTPSLATLIEPFGDLTRHRVLWSAMGASKGYQIFAGTAETLGGLLLLFPRTVTIGALVSLGAMMNVFLVDLFYDIPVKLWALHLAALAVWLILPNVVRLVNALVLNRRAAPEGTHPLARRRWIGWAAVGVQWAITVPILIGTLREGTGLLRQAADRSASSPLYGIWTVDDFILDGETRPPLLSDTLRWQRVIFDFAPYTGDLIVATQEMGGELAPYRATIDSLTRTVSLKRPRTSSTPGPTDLLFTAWTDAHPDAPEATALLTYDRPGPDRVVLEGALNGHRLRATLKKDDRRFELLSRRFSWINDEYDLFNERALR